MDCNAYTVTQWEDECSTRLDPDSEALAASGGCLMKEDKITPLRQEKSSDGKDESENELGVGEYSVKCRDAQTKRLMHCQGTLELRIQSRLIWASGKVLASSSGLPCLLTPY